MNFLNEPAKDEVSKKVLDIVGNLITFTKAVNGVAILVLAGLVEADEEKMGTLFMSVQDLIDNVSAKVGRNAPTIMTVEAAYSVMFSVQNYMPVVIQLDGYLDEIGYPIRDKNGERFSKYLQEMIKF